MNELSAALGAHIRSLRRASKISQEELGFKASISAAHLGQIERGIKNPTVETLGKIAAALDIPLRDLFSFDEPPIARTSSPITDKIDAYLLSMTDDERKYVLRLIRTFKHL